jgi:hypothetical protein
MEQGGGENALLQVMLLHVYLFTLIQVNNS